MADENPVRVIDVFVNELALGALGVEGVTPAVTRRPPVRHDQGLDGSNALPDEPTVQREEIGLHILAYNLKRVIVIIGTRSLMEAIRA